MSQSDEIAACAPVPINAAGFNKSAKIPCGLTPDNVRRAMQDFIDFLGFVNSQLNTKQIERLESFLMPANFSSMVGEFMGAAIPKYCKTVVRNKYHNGYPDILPVKKYPGDSILHATDGIEIKASRRTSGWQGHNPEDVWLMVFCFDSNTSRDAGRSVPPRPFRFVKVLGAAAAKNRLEFLGTVPNQPADDYRERNPKRL